MAYNKKNRLQKVIEIQEIVLDHNKRGIPQEHAYKNVIYPRFRISRATFYNYLGENAKRKLKKMEADERKKNTVNTI